VLPNDGDSSSDILHRQKEAFLLASAQSSLNQLPPNTQPPGFCFRFCFLLVGGSGVPKEPVQETSLLTKYIE
jgi:hypothetical protein